MFNRRWLGIWGTIVAVGCGLSACSSDDGPVTPGSSAGRGGGGGSNVAGSRNVAGDGEGGSGGDGGSGYAGRGGGGESEACHYELQCPSTSTYNCPTTLEGLLKELCGSFADVSRAESACGGTVIDAEYTTHGVTWSFDASNHLTGRTFGDDVPHDCNDGTESFNSIFGENCSAGGTFRPACDGEAGAGGGGGAGGGTDVEGGSGGATAGEGGSKP